MNEMGRHLPDEGVNDFCESYETIRKSHWSPRVPIRKAILDLFATGVPLLDSEQPRIQFLYFHHIFPDEKQSFRNLLRALSEEYVFIPYSEAVAKVANGEIEGKLIALSSDDGFLNNLIAGEVLDELGIKACFFLNPATIGLREDSRIRQFCSERLNTPPIRFLDWNDVENLMRHGHEIGSHGLSHLNIGQIDAKQAQEEIFKSKTILDEKCGGVQHFAYPYGRWSDFNKRNFNQAIEAGYISCATAERGCHTSQCDSKIPIILRDLVIASWPLRHVRFFNAMNFHRKANAQAKWK